MNIDTSFYDQYKSIVKTVDGLETRPAQIEEDARLAIDDAKRFCDHLMKSLPDLNGTPLLAESLFNLIGRREMSGYLGVFIIDNAIIRVQNLSKKEQEIIRQIDSMKIDESLDKFIIETKSWRRQVTIENIKYIECFLDLLQEKANNLCESHSLNEKLGRELEQERRKLKAIEEDRRRGVFERELNREEKRQKAREEFAKSVRIRKKR